jgi:hypothetical protein
LHHAVQLICLKISYQLNDTIDLSVILGLFILNLFPGLDLVSNQKLEPKLCFKPKSLLLVKLKKLLQMLIFVANLVTAQIGKQGPTNSLGRLILVEILDIYSIWGELRHHYKALIVLEFKAIVLLLLFFYGFRNDCV